MLLGIVLIVTAGAILMGAERCRRDPNRCSDIFMTEQGWTRSPFAIKFLGRPKEAREAIVRDASLRNKQIVFSYLLGVLSLCIGIWAIITGATS